MSFRADLPRVEAVTKSSAMVALAFLSACTATTEYIEVPVPVDRFVAVPAELTTPCTKPAIQPETWADVAILAHEALTALDNCNAQMNAIRNLK